MLVFLLHTSGMAGMDVDEYLPPPPPIVDEHKARFQRERVAREIAAAREAAAHEAQAQAREQERQQKALAARPMALQLIEARCASCHEGDAILATKRSRLGWEVLVLRMKWFNGAQLEAGEQPIITSWLANHHGVNTQRAAIEIVALLIVTASALWVVRKLNAGKKRTLLHDHEPHRNRH